jgi:branched-chain amino acid transport system substrate-binding protein
MTINRHRGRSIIPTLLACLAVVAGLNACNGDSAQATLKSRLDRRTLVTTDYAEGKDIHLAVVWDSRKPGFIEGAQLAMEEFNAEAAALDVRNQHEAMATHEAPPRASHRLVLEITDERPFIDTQAVTRTRDEGRYRNASSEAGTKIAEQVLRNPNIAAVVGHMDAKATLSAMLTYQKNGLLLLAGSANDARLEWMSYSDFSDTFGLYFQLRPTDEVLATSIAQAFLAKGWSKVYFAYENNHSNESLVQQMTSEFAKQGLKIYGSMAFRPGGDLAQIKSRQFISHFTELGTSDVDCIVLVTSAIQGAEVIKTSRGIGVLQPFVGVGDFQFPQFVDLVGPSGENTLVTTLYRKDRFVVKRFAERFSKRFPNLEPDETAAMGYDSVRLYTEAVARADTVDPASVSHTLRFDLPIYYGVLGSYVLKDGHSSALKYHVLRLAKEPTSNKLDYVDAD